MAEVDDDVLTDRLPAEVGRDRFRRDIGLYGDDGDEKYVNLTDG